LGIKGRGGGQCQKKKKRGSIPKGKKFAPSRNEGISAEHKNKVFRGLKGPMARGDVGVTNNKNAKRAAKNRAKGRICGRKSAHSQKP